MRQGGDQGMRGMRRPTVVLGVIGSDVHVVGNRILAHALGDAGFEVVNLGVLVPPEEFIAAAIETRADAILVGSLYGHGEIDCREMRQKCQEAGIGDVLLYVGGNLVVGKQEWEPVRERFERELGFDRAFRPETTPAEVIDALREDLAARSRGEDRA